MFNFTSKRVSGKKFQVKMALDKAILESSQKLTIFEVNPPSEEDYEDEEQFEAALQKYEANPKFRGVVSDPDGESFNVNFARSFVGASFGKDRQGMEITFERYCAKYSNPSGCRTPKESKINLEGYVLYVTSGLKKDGTLAVDKSGTPIKFNCYLGAPGSADFAIDPNASKVFDELDKLAESTAAEQSSSASDANDGDDDF